MNQRKIRREVDRQVRIETASNRSSASVKNVDNLFSNSIEIKIEVITYRLDKPVHIQIISTTPISSINLRAFPEVQSLVRMQAAPTDRRYYDAAVDQPDMVHDRVRYHRMVAVPHTYTHSRLKTQTLSIII
jgi:hypothetical protein